MRFNNKSGRVVAFRPEIHVPDDASTTSQQASEMGTWWFQEGEVPRTADVDFVAELACLHKPSDEGLPSCLFVRLAAVDDTEQDAEEQATHDLS